MICQTDFKFREICVAIFFKKMKHGHRKIHVQQSCQIRRISAKGAFEVCLKRSLRDTDGILKVADLIFGVSGYGDMRC
jgi:hypothetical protein